MDEILLGISDNPLTITVIFLDFGWVLTGEMLFSRSARAAGLLRRCEKNLPLPLMFI